MTKTAVAPSRPKMAVWYALQNGRAVVNGSLIDPNTKSASGVTTIEPVRAEWTAVRRCSRKFTRFHAPGERGGTPGRRGEATQPSGMTFENLPEKNIREVY